ncbi:MAG: insulinase family protein, partial [Proteobacteria bacterium]|nr:insulinase family protein [Pseudomonadota bacterium]
MQVEEVKLGQLNTLFNHNPGSTASTVQMWFRAGSALEDKTNQGIAHFLEHMFFKGTPKRPGALLAQEIESFGGEVNAFTSFDYTCYYINSPARKLDHALEILL